MALKPGDGAGGNGERDPRLDLLYRDAPREAPPPHLDAAILAAARREVGARPRSLSAQLRRWRLPVSIAAVVVLSVTLVTLVGEEGKQGLLSDTRSTAETPLALAEKAPEQPVDPAKAPEEARQRMRTAAPEAFSLRLDEGQAKATATPRSATERDARSSAELAAGAETAATPPMAGILGMSQESPPRPAADAPQRQAPPVEVRGSAADAAPPATAPQPKPLADKRMRAEQAIAMKRLPAWHGLEQEPPQKWLERVAELKRQGRTGEANELLAELKRRFPDHPLPSGLE
jgi:hypothetical protein